MNKCQHRFAPMTHKDGYRCRGCGVEVTDPAQMKRMSDCEHGVRRSDCKDSQCVVDEVHDA